MKSKLLTILFLLGIMTGFAQTQKHAFTFYDMIKMKRLSQLTVSPDGRYLAFVVTQYNLKKNNHKTDVYLMDRQENSVSNLTAGLGSNFNPVFSPDGKYLYFLSTRTKKSEIYRYSLQEQKTEKISNLPVSVYNLKISPDGKFFVFSIEAYADESDPQKIAQRIEKEDKQLTSAMEFTELPIRHWDTWENHRWNHLYIMPVEGGEVKDIMAGVEGNCPSKPFGGTEEFAISPDGKFIAYTTKLGRDRMWTTNFDVYLYNVKTGKTRNLTKDNPAWDRAAFFSPDGKYLYYLAMRIPKYEADRFRIMRYDLRSGKKENLTEDFQVNPSDIIITPDGKTIYFTGDKEGRIRIFALNTATKEVKEIYSQHTNKSINYVDNQLFFLQESFTSPAEIYRLDLADNSLNKLSHFNDSILAQVKFGQVEEFWFNDRDGIRVHGWIIKPVDFDPNKKYPLAFYIHGGPQGAWHDSFHYRWNLEIAPSHGYVMVAINFRGSTGYGDAFRLAISGHWGDRPYYDLMDGLAYVLKKYPFIDANRRGALGASYGGYMINYLMGKAPDQFDAFVCHDGLFDLTSMYYATEELWFPEFEMKGTPWQNPKMYHDFSPSTYVTRWQKPILIIHGGQDFRVPETQGFSAFTAAQRRGIPSKLLYFPDENHFVLKPANSEKWHHEVFAWLDKWVKNKK